MVTVQNQIRVQVSFTKSFFFSILSRSHEGLLSSKTIISETHHITFQNTFLNSQRNLRLNTHICFIMYYYIKLFMGILEICLINVFNCQKCFGIDHIIKLNLVKKKLLFYLFQIHKKFSVILKQCSYEMEHRTIVCQNLWQ